MNCYIALSAQKYKYSIIVSAMSCYCSTITAQNTVSVGYYYSPWKKKLSGNISRIFLKINMCFLVILSLPPLCLTLIGSLS